MNYEKRKGVCRETRINRLDVIREKRREWFGAEIE